MAGNASTDKGWLGWILLVLIGAAVYFWSDAKPNVSKSQAEALTISSHDDPPSTADSLAANLNPLRGEFNESRAATAARNFLSGETYEATVGSVDCTDDCSGHEAGWQWSAEGNDCIGGNSASFEQGCTAFEAAAEERVTAAKQAYESGDDTFEGG